MKKVFICSPLRGEYQENIKNAKKYARYAALKGNAVFAPHLLYTLFLTDDKEDERNIGIQSGKTFMSFCDEVWVFAKDEKSCSEGMLQEIEATKSLSKVVKFVDPKVVEGMEIPLKRTQVPKKGEHYYEPWWEDLPLF